MTHPAYGRLRAVTDTASVLLADNPGLLTLEGTNTWVLHGPHNDELVIVDPGPNDDEHIARIAALGRIALVLISHRHGDHTDAIDKLVEQTGAPVRSAGSGFLRGLSGELIDGEVIDAAGLKIKVMATPGHTADSLSFVLDDAVLTDLTRSAAKFVPGAQFAGITVVRPKRGIDTVAATHDYVVDLDNMQRIYNEGPCLTAARDNQVVRVDDLAACDVPLTALDQLHYAGEELRADALDLLVEPGFAAREDKLRIFVATVRRRGHGCESLVDAGLPRPQPDGIDMRVADHMDAHQIAPSGNRTTDRYGLGNTATTCLIPSPRRPSARRR